MSSDRDNSWKRRPLLSAAIVVGLAVFTALASYSPLMRLALRIQGHALTLDSFEERMEVPRAGSEVTAEFTVRNITGRTVTVFAASTNCGCAVVTNLPIAIPAGQSRPLVFRVTTEPHQAGQVVMQEARLILDQPSPPVMLRLVLRVGGPQASTPTRTASEHTKKY